jgi:tetratricopeptide (TPR) repeat protein
MIQRLPRASSTIALAGFCILCFLAYAPGLSGGFIYDDWGSITGNANIQVHSGTLAKWWRAAILFPSGTPPFRSLTMLSFAANYFVGELDPFGYKLTNVLIHLVNGVLLYFALRAVFALRRGCAAPSEAPRFDEGLVAASIAGLWLLLPINLTAVLYVVQRLEALAATFAFLGLGWYAHARLRYWQGRGGALALWLSIGVPTAVGLLFKETAIMLPLYAGVLELCLPRARTRDGTLSRPIVALYATMLLLPFVIGLLWLWRPYLGSAELLESSYVRIITEARVLVDYIHWTIAPSLDALTLYHDDIMPSRGLFDPWTTIASIAVLGALLAAAFWERRQRPFFSLGVLWFFAGHVLTATVIPLILAFEHRNYFSSAALLLAVSSVIVLEGPIARKRLRIAIVVAAALFYAGTTWMRASEWSDGLKLAAADAMKRPTSSAAQYDYAQALLMESAKKHEQKSAQEALKVLDSARRLPGAGIHFEQSIITLLGESGYPAPDTVWDSLIGKLRAAAPDTNGVHALSRLNHCFQNDQCKPAQRSRLAEAYDAAFSHGQPSEGLLAIHAEYAWHVANDRDAAERDYREALRTHPNDIAAQMNLAVVLIYQGKREEAQTMIDAMERRNHLHALDAFIAPLRQTLAAVKAGETSSDQ